MNRKDVAIPLTVTLAVQALISMAAVTVPVFAPTAAADIGMSASYVGIYVGLIYFSSMASSLLSGDFILRYGALRISQICLIFCGIGLSLTTVTGVPALVASALIIGLGYGPATPASSHILARHTPEHLMAFIFSLKQTGVPLGGALAGAIVPSLVLLAGWKFCSLAVSASCILLAISIQPFRAKIDGARRLGRHLSFKGITRPFEIVFSHPPLLQLAFISFCFACMQVSLVTYLVIYLTKNVGMALIMAGLILSAAQIAGMVGRIVWGFVADRYLKPRLVLGFLGVATTLEAVATAFFNPGWSYPAIWLTIILFGATAIGWNGIYLAEAARLAPEGQVGMATGGTLFFTFLGVAVGSPIFAAIVTSTGSYPSGFIIFAILTFACGMAVILFRDKKSN